MKSLSTRFSLVGVFAGATILLMLYLLSMRYHVYLNVSVFWTAVTVMIATIVYQSLIAHRYPGYPAVVLTEIIIAALAFHMIYQIPYYGLNSADSYRNMGPLKSILQSGFINGKPEYASPASQFPLIHILGSQVSLVGGFGVFSVVKWLPSLIDLALIPVLYLLVSGVFKDTRTALISTLLFASLEHHISFSSAFIDETLALVFAGSCVYLYFSARDSSCPLAYRVLAIVCVIATVLAHHLTSFMLLLFLLTHLTVTQAARWRLFRGPPRGDAFSGQTVALNPSFVLFAFVSIIAYWTYLAQSPLHNLVSLVRDFFTFNLWGQTLTASVSGSEIATTRGYIIFYGFYFFVGIFSVILLFGLLRRSKEGRAEKFSFTLYLFICGVLGLVSLYAIPAQATPDRFLMYGWFFGFAPLALAIFASKGRWLTAAGVVLLLTSMLFNIYMIDPTAWDHNAQGVSFVTSREDYALAASLDFSQGTVLAHQNDVMAIYDVYNNLGTIAFGSVKADFTEFDWVVVQKEELRIQLAYHPQSPTQEVADMERLESDGVPGYDRVYESRNLTVFRRNS